MFIETLSIYASIIGLSMTLVDKYKVKYPKEVSEALASLKALAVTGKAWKEIHTKYHAIERNISTILSPTEKIVDGKRISRTLIEVNSFQLKECIQDDLNWQNCIESLEHELKPYMKTLEHASNNAELEGDEIIDRLYSKGSVEIAQLVSAIVTSQAKILELHNEFITFLKDLKRELKIQRWGDQQVEMILQNRELIRTRLPMVVGNTDRALMAILELYNGIISEA